MIYYTCWQGKEKFILESLTHSVRNIITSFVDGSIFDLVILTNVMIAGLTVDSSSSRYQSISPACQNVLSEATHFVAAGCICTTSTAHLGKQLGQPGHLGTELGYLLLVGFHLEVDLKRSLLNLGHYSVP